jgi:2-polyprenyl-3-methyl-5-hydroxy-6-metoxy-1,4-benzoquinol methylase
MGCLTHRVQLLHGTVGSVHLEPLPDGRHKITVTPPPDRAVARRVWTTRYPVELIRAIHAVKGLFLCDEIMREEDPHYVEHAIRRRVFTYIEPQAFAGRRVLDFGCGAGASTLVLSRLLPPCELVGIELEHSLLDIARLRARNLARTSIHWLQSPSGSSLPPDLGEFDFVMFNAVFEHLLPTERQALLPTVWARLKPGGVLFLNQTPHRWAPVEVHTTGGVPLINYLPDRLALHCARTLSQRVRSDEQWETLLRRGIRGGTITEIVQILGGPEHAVLLKPLAPLRDRIDLWLGTLSSRHGLLKRAIWGSLKIIKAATGAEITPDLSLAIRKVGER